LSADAGQRPTLKLRSAGLIFRGDDVLLHRGRDDDFWTLPGGTIELGERSDETLRREIKEELHVGVRAVRLLWVVENRFDYQQRRFHEIGFYWLLVNAEGDWPQHRGQFRVSEPDILFRWVTIVDLPRIPIKPSFLVDGIGSLPATTMHLQIDDGHWHNT
jgi:ADP-ribose pyrophosphatase YjhB (NUDIX family)